MIAVQLVDKFLKRLSAAFDSLGNLDISSLVTGSYIAVGGVRIYFFTSALSAGVTATSAPAGSFAVTSHATGRGVIFQSDGSAWQLSGSETTPRYKEVTISAADIVATGAGKLGHAEGYPLVAAPGADKAIEVISVVVINDFATAAYTGGGNVSANYAGGGSALTGVVSAANSIGAAADKSALLLPAVPTNNQLVANTAVNLVAASAFTQPGTAAGVVRVKVAYRVHTLGL